MEDRRASAQLEELRAKFATISATFTNGKLRARRLSARKHRARRRARRAIGDIAEGLRQEERVRRSAEAAARRAGDSGHARREHDGDAAGRIDGGPPRLLVAAVSFYVFLPSLLSVFGSWRSLSHLDPRFAVLALGCEVASFFCLWQLDRIALRTRAWFPVITAQLSGNAVGRIVPGGGATSTAVTVSMLHRASRPR